VLREWLGRGIRPQLQLEAMLTVFAVDALLLPVAVVLALQAALRPEVLLALVPFCILLAAIARERNARVCEAADRVSALEVERDRIDIAMHRTSRSLAAPLDGLDALEVAVGTTVDALGAAAGRARFAGSHDATVFESLPRQAGAAESSALLAAERSALAGHDEASCEEEGWFALAVPVRRGDAQQSTAAISICRAEHPFSDSERRLFGYLVAQAGAALERGDLLGRVAAQERLDPLLGIANRHSLRDELNRMLERAEQTETPLSVLMLDVDGLRHVNETYGEEAGDAVLQAIGAFALERCRLSDLAARYEEDTLVLVLTGTSLEGARLVAEDVRTGVGRLSVATALEVPLTVSVGIVERSPAAASAEVVLEAALRALQDAKLGRGR
jgi:diguanylate cyclase (GGDEF)-like protein